MEKQNSKFLKYSFAKCSRIFISLALIFIINFSSIAAVIYSPGTGNLSPNEISPLNDPALNGGSVAPSGTSIDKNTAQLISQIVINSPTAPANNFDNNNVASKVVTPTALTVPTINNINTIAPVESQPNQTFASTFVEKNVSTTAPSISAPAYIVINATNHHIYASKDMNVKYEPAGLANLMTAYLATQFFSFDKVLTVNKTAVTGVDKDASIAALDVGDKITLYDALASMFIKGCVDSANVVAENVSGSIDEFVNLMNDTARSLGLTNTIFMNPSGINNEAQLISPLDMAIVMSKVCENKELVDLLALTEHTLPASRRRDKLMLFSRNSQLIEGNSTYNPSLSCSRLGYNEKARYCVASMAKYQNNNIIAIVLKANGSQFSDTKKLIDFGLIACAEDVN